MVTTISLVDRSAPQVSRAELLAQTPPEILAAFPDVPWRIADLHALRLPVVRIDVENLSWLLELPLWQLNGRRFQVTPVAVATDPSCYPHHYRRVMTADLSYPIHCVEHQERMVALDGVHRLLRARICGHDSIDAMIVSPTELVAISR